MPTLPTSRTAWLLTLGGLGLLLLSLALQWPMLSVVSGAHPASPGGAESIVALFFGLPALVLACLLLGIASVPPRWRCVLSVVPFCLSLAGLFGWVAALLR